MKLHLSTQDRQLKVCLPTPRVVCLLARRPPLTRSIRLWVGQNHPEPSPSGPGADMRTTLASNNSNAVPRPAASDSARMAARRPRSSGLPHWMKQ